MEDTPARSDSGRQGASGPRKNNPIDYGECCKREILPGMCISPCEVEQEHRRGSEDCIAKDNSEDASKDAHKICRLTGKLDRDNRLSTACIAESGQTYVLRTYDSFT